MNWGIISYGGIAPKFIKSLQAVEGQNLYAIATASQVDRARQDHPKCKIYNRYQDLYEDEEVDIIYISSTHNFHFEQGMKSLQAGKHVLCEKPMTTSTELTARLIKEAKENNLFLMEAIWTKYMPGYMKVLELVRKGIVGEIKLVRASFSFANEKNKKRLYDKALAGGSTYDIGLYNISLALDVFQHNPSKISAAGVLSETGVDEASITTLLFPGGGIADLHCGFRIHTDKKAVIYGTDGWIEMDLHWQVERFRHYNANGELQKEYHYPMQSTGYVHEIKGAVQCIQDGAIESKLIPHKTSMSLATIMDVILGQLGYNA